CCDREAVGAPRPDSRGAGQRAAHGTWHTTRCVVSLASRSAWPGRGRTRDSETRRAERDAPRLTPEARAARCTGRRPVPRPPAPALVRLRREGPAAATAAHATVHRRPHPPRASAPAAPVRPALRRPRAP